MFKGKKNIKDLIRINYFKICSRLKYIFKYQTNQDLKSRTSDYKLVFEENFSDLSVWRIGMEWGDFNPGDNKQYFGKDNRFVYVSDNKVSLTCLYAPKTFYKKDLEYWQISPDMGEDLTIYYGIGLIKSNQKWKYGFFEFEAMLPEGKNLWPGIWLTSANSWPPEIDIVEAYSDKGNFYAKNGLLDWKIQPNLHYGYNNEQTHFRAENFPVRGCTKRWVRYTLHWEKEFIKIYYDGQLVLHTDNKKIMNWFSDDNSYMNIVLNNGVFKKGLISDDSALRVRSVKVYQK